MNTRNFMALKLVNYKFGSDKSAEDVTHEIINFLNVMIQERLDSLEKIAMGASQQGNDKVREQATGAYDELHNFRNQINL